MERNESRDYVGLPPVPELPEELRARMDANLQAAEDLRVALGRPPEAKYDLLRVMFGRRIHTEETFDADEPTDHEG